MFKIKYVLINYINWIKFNKKVFFVLLINLSMIVGVIIYLFSFNNNLLHSKEPSISKMIYGRKYTVKGEMNTDEVYMIVNKLINNEQLPEIEFIYFSGMADIGDKKGKVTTVKFFKDELRGYYYDKKYDIMDHGKVALATDSFINVIYGTAINKDIQSININGKDYVVEYTREQFIDSMEVISGLVLVRISYDDFVDYIRSISEVIIIFDARLDKEQEAIFRSEMQKLQNSREIIIQPKETSDQKNYKIEMVIDTILLLSALLCLVEIYAYILDKRKKEFTVYKICGAGKNFILKILTIELLFLTLTGFFIGAILFQSTMFFTGTMKYIYFDIETLGKTFIIILCCMGIVAGKLSLKLNKKSLTDIKKEAMQR